MKIKISPKLIIKEKHYLEFEYNNINFRVKHYHDFNDHANTKNTKEILFLNNENNIKAIKENPNSISEIYNWIEKSEDSYRIQECTRIMEACDFYLNPEKYLEDFDYLNNPYLTEEYIIKINNIINGINEIKTIIPKLNPGYIYVIEALNYYKIGRSKEFNYRTKFLNTIMPIDTTLIHSFHSLDYTKAEKFLHNKYQHLHYKGEWFSLTGKEVEEIKAIQDDTV